MRYREDKEQSAEFLRLALPLMARQDAAYHPVSYSLWYEHVAGLNPPLTEVLTARLASDAALTEDEAYRLHARYISARDVKLLESLQQQLRRTLDEAAHNTARAGNETERFGRTLEEGRSQIASAVSVKKIQDLITQLLTETLRMEGTALALAQQLDARAAEVRDLTEQLQRAQTEALLDPLCGLHNRRGLEREAQDLAGPDGELAGAALLIADIDHFKRVNDTYGHLLGDKVLRTIAQTMRSNIKGRDIAARIGGEEFAVLLPRTTLQGAQALAEQLRRAVANGRIHRGPGEVIGSVTLSIGVAVAGPGEGFEALMVRADAALYAAKREGRNRICVAAPPEPMPPS